MTKVVELVGLSGSGKTTILRRCFLTNGITQKLHTDVKVVKLKKPYIFTQLAAFVIIIFKIFVKSPLTLYYLMSNKFGIGLLLKLSYRNSMKRDILRNNNTIYIIEDSGVLMPIISSVIEDNISWNKISLPVLLGVINLPDYCIFVKTKSEKAYTRFITRQQSRDRNTALPVFGDRSRIDSVPKHKFINAECYVERLKHCLNNKGKVICYEYDNSNKEINCNKINLILLQIEQHRYGI